MSVEKEISADGRNRVAVTALFDDPRPACEKWTTYPVWLIIPKVADGFGLEVDARPISRKDEPRVSPEKPIEWTER